MKRFLSLILLASSFCLFNACEKDYSKEGGTPPTTGGGGTGGGTSDGTLGGSPGACANAVVKGSYGQGIAATDSNYATVEVTVTTKGTYTIGTDTVNGIYFTGTGTFATTGAQTVKIKAQGTPVNPGTFTFNVRYKTSTCSFTVDVAAVAPAPASDYFPTTTNSNWTYKDIDPLATPADTVRVTSTGQTFPFVSNTFILFDRELDSAYYRKGAGIYWEYGDMDLAGFTDSGAVVERNMLIDNVPAGNSWETAEKNVTINNLPASVKSKMTITEKNVSKTIDSKVYANVIVVKTSFQAKVPIVGFQELYYYETWYAKGIGMIYLKASDPTGTNSFGLKVQRYQIF